MQTPTIVKQTKDYMLVKIPLPQREEFVNPSAPSSPQMGRAEKRLWKIIQKGEREYREGKTIRAKSSQEALAIYERQRNKKHRV